MVVSGDDNNSCDNNNNNASVMSVGSNHADACCDIYRVEKRHRRGYASRKTVEND